MTRRVGNVVIIEPTEDAVCELCGKVAELRPYGPNGENICYGCGEKDKAITKKKMHEMLFGIDKDLN